MKLLFDQNISFRLLSKINDIFPESYQVRELGLENSTDLQIWSYAKRNKMSIVTFDADFYDLSILKGYPPKIIWLRVGNKTTNNLEIVLRRNYNHIQIFLNTEESSELGCFEINK
ncbi:MAG: DUF5615 family PIN-like protein [Saprospiraceae bacterium]|nr:DUF5615 family PIN-like protein [Saprospiraceae bacterium]